MMRLAWIIGSVALIALAATGALSGRALAQQAPSIQTVTNNCSAGSANPCGTFLVNPNTGGRVVVNLERRMASNTQPTLYDRQLREVTESNATREVLLSAGARAPLVETIVLAVTNGSPSVSARYEYRILGHHAPLADDIADDAQQNADDYFRLVVVRDPRFDNTDVCRIGAVAHEMRGLHLINFHPTKTITVSHRNTAPRYGANPAWRTQLIPPGGVAATAVGCVTDIPAGFIQLDGVRFVS